MKLTDFYKQVVEDNESFTRGWSTTHYGVFSKVINDNDYKKIAEIGIGYGCHAKFVLKTTNAEKFYLIDPMKFYPGDNFAIDIMSQEPEVAGENFNELYAMINEYLSDFKGKFYWLRKESLQVSVEEIPDESLDCVFVDGDHTYDAALNDIRFWMKKVRPGGQLLGDDYWLDSVAQAVHSFENESGMKADFLCAEGRDYKVFRFQK